MLDQFDFVCISLHNRTDRRDKIKRIFQELGILKEVNWWIVQKHPRGGVYGCFESHWSIWNSSEYTKPYLCVFEDDIEGSAREKFLWALNRAQKYLPEHFDLLNMEPGHGYVDSQVEPNLFSGFFVHLGCYVMHRSFLPIISERTLSSFGVDIDAALYKNCRMLAILPKFFYQNVADSDNGGGYRAILPSVQKLSPFLRKIEQLSPIMSLVGMDLFSQWIQFHRVTNFGPFDLQDRRVESPLKPTKSGNTWK